MNIKVNGYRNTNRAMSEIEIKLKRMMQMGIT